MLCLTKPPLTSSLTCEHPFYSPMVFSHGISLNTASPAAVINAGLADMLLLTLRLLLAVLRVYYTCWPLACRLACL